MERGDRLRRADGSTVFADVRYFQPPSATIGRARSTSAGMGRGPGRVARSTCLRPTSNHPWSCSLFRPAAPAAPRGQAGSPRRPSGLEWRLAQLAGVARQPLRSQVDSRCGRGWPRARRRKRALQRDERLSRSAEFLNGRSPDLRQNDQIPAWMPLQEREHPHSLAPPHLQGESWRAGRLRSDLQA